MALDLADIQSLARALADEMENRKEQPPPVVQMVNSKEAELARLYGIDRAAFFLALKKQNAARRRQQMIKI